MSTLSDPVRKRKPTFHTLSRRGSRWAPATLCMIFCPLPLALLLLILLPERITHGPLANAVMTGYGALWMLALVYGMQVARQDRVALVAAPLEEAEVQYLPLYISAYLADGEKVRDRAARILCDLLGRMSAEELECLPDDCWTSLCPPPKITPTGYSAGERVGHDDPVHAAVFSAITRVKRLKSLPRIESWMRHLDPKRHSEDYVRTLTECYETLRNVRNNAQHSDTLLRASSAETTPGTLLRPIAGISASTTDTGEQLLRASQEAEKGRGE